MWFCGGVIDDIIKLMTSWLFWYIIKLIMRWHYWWSNLIGNEMNLQETGTTQQTGSSSRTQTVGRCITPWIFLNSKYLNYLLDQWNFMRHADKFSHDHLICEWVTGRLVILVWNWYSA
jgi:hypothetical protein